MQSKQVGPALNGSFQKGNFIWGGAMNLAWSELVTNLNKEPLSLAVSNEVAQKMVDNFNSSVFGLKDLSTDCYYVKSGFGQETVTLINQESKNKFPKKSLGKLTLLLKPTDIISYAYFFKEVQYQSPFAASQNFQFKNHEAFVKVKSLKATKSEHFKNIDLLDYNNDKEFVVRLRLKQPNQELFVIMGHQTYQPEEIVKLTSQGKNNMYELGQNDAFEMPFVEFDIYRSYTQVINSVVKSGNLKGYIIGAMFQKIKFKIDEVGAKVQNSAVMMLLGFPSNKHKKLIVNQPFWIVMKQKGCHPYFVAQINNSEFMIPKK